MNRNLNELRDKIHKNAKAKGFYDDEKYIRAHLFDFVDKNSIKHAFFAQKIALIHSELSEALEAERKGKKASLSIFLNELDFGEWDNKMFGILIKNSVEDELADVIIRTLDLCGHLGIDIEKHIELKMRYNESREHKHGKNY